MKILYLNGADNEGGAAKAATRLLHGVHDLGADVSLYVQRRFGDDPLVTGPASKAGKLMGFARPTLEEIALGIRPGRRSGPFCAAFLPDRLQQQVNSFSPDIVHLHWVARMMRLETLARIKVPVVWTMHDSWAFTGGCYLPPDCTRYEDSCGNCPVLNSTNERDLSRRVWERKRKAWQGMNLTLIAPSRWMAERARESSIFKDARIEVIPNGIDVQRYKPVEKALARSSLSLPQEKKLVLFGAKGAMTDRNKGFHLLAEALRKLARGPMRDRLELVVFGTSAAEQPQELGFPVRYLGWLGDDVTIATLYSAADLFVFPSIQESLGYTGMEAMACGTPCVAFDQGGVPDLIVHRANGYLARPYDPEELAQGIAWVLEREERLLDLGDNARRKVVQEFSVEKVAERHLALYADLLRQ